MIKFNQYVHFPLTWKQNGIFKRGWTLYQDDRPLLELRQDRGAFRSDCTVYVEGIRLCMLRETGVFKRQIVVESDDLALTTGKIAINGWRNTFEISFPETGNQYVWKKPSVFRSERLLLDPEQPDDPLATMTRNTWSTGGTITIHDGNRPNEEIAVLILAGLFEEILEIQRAAAATAAAA